MVSACLLFVAQEGSVCGEAGSVPLFTIDGPRHCHVVVFTLRPSRVLGPHPDCGGVVIPSEGRLLPILHLRPQARAFPLPVWLPGGLTVCRPDPLPVGRGSESRQASALP